MEWEVDEGTLRFDGVGLLDQGRTAFSLIERLMVDTNWPFKLLMMKTLTSFADN